MASLRRRIKKLERAAMGEKTTLVCPTCGEEFMVYGDAPVEYLCWMWRQGYEGETYGQTPEDVLALTRHPHDASFFVDKVSGLPFMGEFFKGTERVWREDVPDLSEK
jgi:hypothetical protein